VNLQNTRCNYKNKNSLTVLSIKALLQVLKHTDCVICVKHPNQIKLN
jgi:hypothetical protein